MWDEAPEAMTGALARHDEIMRSVVEHHSGIIFKHTGDGICAAFESPGDALDAGLAVQAAFRAEVFSIGQMAVRVAIHTGEAEEQHGDYRGPALNRVARLLDVAVGGDILLTDVAEGMVRATLPADVELADLGEHRLRDIKEPGHVYYVEMPGKARAGRAAAPWLAALAATALVAGAIAMFSLTSPPGTGTPETTIAPELTTTVPVASPTTGPVGEVPPKWVVYPGGTFNTLTAHDDVVIAGSQSTGLHAYWAAGSAGVWPAQGLVVDADRPLVEPFGAPVAGTPVVGNQLVFYSTLLGTLHAVDFETGELRWWHRFERCLGDECTPVVPSQPAIRGDAVVVAAGSDLYKFDAPTGDFLRVEGGFGSAMAGPTFGGDFVYVAERSSVFQYRAEDLTLLQSLFVGDDLPVGYQADVRSLLTPAVPSELGLGADHAVLVTDAEGLLTRRSLTSGSVHPAWVDETGSPIPIPAASVPAVGAGLNDRNVPVLWTVDSTGRLLGIDADSGGTVRTHQVGPTTQSVALGGEGIVYVATDTAELIAYDPIADEETFRQPLAVAPNASPVEVAGVVFVAGIDGSVRAYAAGGEVELDSPLAGASSIDGAVGDVNWSSSGDLAFEHAGDIWVLGPQGEEPVNLTRLSGGGSAPVWSPDADFLAFISGSVGSDIFLMRPDGTGRRNLTVTPGADEVEPAWSPDGSRIVFSSQECADQGGPQPERVCLSVSELNVVDLSGRIRPLVGVPVVFASDREPDWSPIGNQVAFASDRSVGGLPIGAGWHLWTVSTAGSDLTPVVGQEEVAGRSPTFSPDGLRLAFIAGGGRAGVDAVFVADVATGDTVRVTDLPIGAGAPTWSPDGTRLAFTWDGSQLGRIYTVSAAAD
jgi:outer membrane protein assembly factor BamB